MRPTLPISYYGTHAHSVPGLGGSGACVAFQGVVTCYTTEK